MKEPEPTARATYATRRRENTKRLKRLAALLAKHAESAQHAPNDWSMPAELGRVAELLDEAIKGLGWCKGGAA